MWYKLAWWGFLTSTIIGIVAFFFYTVGLLRSEYTFVSDPAFFQEVRSIDILFISLYFVVVALQGVMTYGIYKKQRWVYRASIIFFILSLVALFQERSIPVFSSLVLNFCVVMAKNQFVSKK